MEEMGWQPHPSHIFPRIARCPNLITSINLLKTPLTAALWATLLFHVAEMPLESLRVELPLSSRRGKLHLFQTAARSNPLVDYSGKCLENAKDDVEMMAQAARDGALSHLSHLELRKSFLDNTCFPSLASAFVCLAPQLTELSLKGSLCLWQEDKALLEETRDFLAAVRLFQLLKKLRKLDISGQKLLYHEVSGRRTSRPFFGCTGGRGIFGGANGDQQLRYLWQSKLILNRTALPALDTLTLGP
jgi:hypothetical protein